MNGGNSEWSFSVGQCATLACVLEATAPKPGNVHRHADFESLKFSDFLISAVGIGPTMERASEQGVGVTTLAAAQSTWSLVQTNTNLGTVLLLAPLAAVDTRHKLRDGIAGVLNSLNADDARAIYQAIRLMHPGGMGKVDTLDLASSPPTDILAAMQLAAKRDLVARQYTNCFTQVFDSAAWLIDGLHTGWTLMDTIVRTHVRLMASFPDSLIARKCGPQLAGESRDRAGAVLESGTPGEADYERALVDLDSWLRADGHRRNPGTTADLIAAGLFVALRERTLTPPFV